MEKADRDQNNALRAEYECKQLVTQFPNSKFEPETEQKLRNIQEALAQNEMFVGDYYHHKGANAAAANRLSGVVDQYPLFSRADFALWEEADSLRKMGKPAREKEGEALQKIVRDYPLSPWVEQSKKRLKDLEMPIPEPDPRAIAHMRYEMENRTKLGLYTRSTEFLKRGPDVSMAAKSGMPTMTNPKQTVPLSVPIPATAVANTTPATGVNDVTIAPVANGSSALDTKPDARTTLPAKAATADPNAPKTGLRASGGQPEEMTAAAAKANQPNAVSNNKKKKKKKTSKTDQPTKPSSQE